MVNKLDIIFSLTWNLQKYAKLLKIMKLMQIFLKNQKEVKILPEFF